MGLNVSRQGRTASKLTEKRESSDIIGHLSYVPSTELLTNNFQETGK